MIYAALKLTMYSLLQCCVETKLAYPTIRKLVPGLAIKADGSVEVYSSYSSPRPPSGGERSASYCGHFTAAGEAPMCPLNVRLGGPHNFFEKEKISFPCRESKRHSCFTVP